MSELNVKYPSANVKIIIDNGIVNKEWSFLNREFRYIVITDTNLTKFYAKLLSTIPNLETILAIKPGEKAKSISVYENHSIPSETKYNQKRYYYCFWRWSYR